jgi:putative DNA primase/helicase
VSAYSNVIAALEARGCRRSGHDWQCPAHDDGRASLGVRAAKDRALLKCQAGCPTEDVVAALGMGMKDLFDDAGRLDARAESATYDYVDESGALLFQVVRFWPKEFRQRPPMATAGGHGALTA